jgi:NAD(P)-dependent dehydrogenase (short-subunit alcohol dehydrogenase family)
MTDNAVCLVTGATSGIGRATAPALAPRVRTEGADAR